MKAAQQQQQPQAIGGWRQIGTRIRIRRRLQLRLPLLAVGAACLGVAIAACGSHDVGAQRKTDTTAPPATTAPSADAEKSPTTLQPPAGSEGAKNTRTPDGKAPTSFPDLYDPETIPKFELTFDAAALAVLSDPNIDSEKTWVHGSFKMGAITFADVGVRRKGSSSFRALPKKASLKVKLNKWVKGQKLYGLSEITLNNMVNDAASLSERLAYHVFRSLGLPAERANTAQVMINGEDYGIYANIETPNEAFLARVFGANAKTLYEVNAGSMWLPGSESGYEIDIADPKAPVGAMPDLALLFQVVATAKDATLITDLAGCLHTTQWLRYSAAEALTGFYDGYAFGPWFSHNYFMAGDTDGKFSLVPWSADEGLSDREGVQSAALPRGDTVLARCKLGETCWAAYKTEVAAVLAVYETLDLVSLARKWHAQIDALATADPKREPSLDQYHWDTELLFKWLADRPAVIRTQLGL